MSAHTGLTSLAFIGMPGGLEWMLILLVALLLFGRNLPRVMRDVGRALRAFRESMDLEGPRPAPRSPPTEPVTPRADERDNDPPAQEAQESVPRLENLDGDSHD